MTLQNDIGPADTPPHAHCNSALIELLIAESKPILIDFAPIDAALVKLDSCFWTGSLDALLLVTERAFGVARKVLLSADRQHRTVEARNALIWVTRELTPWSLKDMGRRFNRDHSTIMHALRRAERQRDRDIRYRVLTGAMVDALRASTITRQETPDAR